MGQRMVQLDSSYTGHSDGSAILYASQLPPNPAILVPGPAFIFVVIKGVPSVGVKIMIGSGQIEEQQTLSIGSLPSSSMPQTVVTAGALITGTAGARSVHWSVTQCLMLACMLLVAFL